MFRFQHHPLSSTYQTCLRKTPFWHALDASTDTPVCATIPLRTPFFHDLQVSKHTLSSCLAPIYTLPLWMTLLLFPSLPVVATSMEFFCPPCHLLFLPVPQPCYYCCCLLKAYRDVAYVDINKLSVNPSALKTCAPNTT